MEARLAGDRVQIEVSDTGPGADCAPTGTPSTGVGLANIRDRLVQAYGADQRLVTRLLPEGGFAVTIDLPFQLEDMAGASR